MTLLPRVLPCSEAEKRTQIERELLRQEAKIGGALFGPLPKGRERQFFCLDRYTWIWHETWKDENGKWRTVTTRYELRPDGVLKSQDGQGRQRVGRDELRHLYQAALLYRDKVVGEYQQALPHA